MESLFGLIGMLRILLPSRRILRERISSPWVFSDGHEDDLKDVGGETGAF